MIAGKLYTQQEVDVLLEKREEKQEGQVVNKQKRLNSKAVENLVKKSNRILVSISSHAFPLDIFPDTINIEEGRIIEGLRIFENKQIDTFNYTKKELIAKLEELSTTRIVT
ncbi:MAG: hypothetical protein NTZ93_02090 [Candidatus Beckwithbacteria bacterium]|nr:hypothetical protein [Candidatus Beckwithbacteria bacterium]